MKRALALGLLAMFLGCNSGGSSGTENETENMSEELFTPTTANTDATCVLPGSPWGHSMGHTLKGWTITDCDGHPYTLHNDDFCKASATVLIQVEGWCGVCQADAPQLRSMLIEPYARKGVRFMQVLSTDDHYGTISGDFCNAWASRYNTVGFTFMDPDNKLSTYSYTPGVDEEPSPQTTQALPVVRVLDADGKVYAEFQGGDEQWTRVRGALDTLLDQASAN